MFAVIECTDAEFTIACGKIELVLREFVLTLEEGLDSKLGNVYKPSELRRPLRSISLDP